jgi:hypothetical protein
MAFSPYGAYWRDMRRLFAAELLGASHVWAAVAELERNIWTGHDAK